MQDSEELLRRIVEDSRICSRKRKRAVLRELGADFEENSILAAREAGRSDDEIRQLVLTSFGDPGQVAEGFAWVYRQERAMLRVGVFLLSTLAVAILLSATVLALQAGVAIGFGASVQRVIGSRHTVIEALDILSTVAAYVGFISIEKLFDGHRFQKAFAVVTLIFAVAAAGCAEANVHAPFLVFGFVSGVFLRTLQVFMRNSVVRTGVAIACFAAGGIVSFQIHPSAFRYAVALNTASWLVMGAGYQLMAGLVPRIDEALWSEIQRS